MKFMNYESVIERRFMHVRLRSSLNHLKKSIHVIAHSFEEQSFEIHIPKKMITLKKKQGSLPSCLVPVVPKGAAELALS